MDGRMSDAAEVGLIDEVADSTGSRLTQRPYR